uniref:CD247 antigen like n=1 Tax=Semicossyphus pulcher TaxID=241346 RepID=UPI0037E8A0C0
MDVETFFSEPFLCCILDGVLITYCLVATAFFFREKFSCPPPVPVDAHEENGCIYQELERPRDADPYQVLEPSKRKKKAAKKKKPASGAAEGRDENHHEFLVPQGSSSPLPPQ